MRNTDKIRKVFVIGSGPIAIGQAAEFDYSGTQACKALKEEGIEVILVNSNPATIMTDMEIADKVYIEPITLEFVKKIIMKERPDGILASFGGQTGLNMAVQLSEDGILDAMGIKILGTSLDSIKKAEDRKLFKTTMQEIGEKVPFSKVVTSIAEAVEFAGETGFPLIVRPAYTLGGTGGGFAESMADLVNICTKGLNFSLINQVLLEQSVSGWKEIEYEVMRDGNDNCIVICNMENFDPVGVHTGDSIVVVPSQTLSDKEYQMLRTASIKIIRALGIEGGCNIQFALNPDSYEYVVIEVNPRVSRSSALASKATGYPIARVSAKIAIGLTLDEITNPVTGNTSACFEPSVDYIVTKVPRWPFDKFASANRILGTQMKATGEVMAIGRSFEESLLKAIDSLDVKFDYQLGLSLFDSKSKEELLESIRIPSDERIFAICKAIQKGVAISLINEITKIDVFFLKKLEYIVALAEEIKNAGIAWLDYSLYYKAKKAGFGDSYIANLVGTPLEEILKLKRKYSIKPVYKIVDTCAGEFDSSTPYFYSTYEETDDSGVSGKRKVLVIGSGPIRIGQGIEFDYCSVHSVKALKDLGIESIIINNNPETVSTDFDTSDRLYFEPITKECVLDVIEKEKVEGVIVQFGGQTSINLAAKLEKEGVKILGTSVESIDAAEDRDKFIKLLKELDIPFPPGGIASTPAEALGIAAEIGYPVLVRPSYVLGGRAMEIVGSDRMLEAYLTKAKECSEEHPVLIDKYIIGKEAEVDGISDGEDILIPGIMEHIESAGVHSGDSIAVYPPCTLSAKVKEKIAEYALKLAKALRVIGLFNIQFIIDKADMIYIIEVNPRASRTIPIMSKITGIPMVNIATRLIVGEKLKDITDMRGLVRESSYTAVKAPVFSFSKLAGVDSFLGPEMKSTGEVMGVDKDYHRALYKALIASGLKIPDKGKVLFCIDKAHKEICGSIVEAFSKMNFKIIITEESIFRTSDDRPGSESVACNMAIELIKKGEITLVINTKERGEVSSDPVSLIRKTSMEYGIPCMTSLDTVRALLEVMEMGISGSDTGIYSLDQYIDAVSRG